MNLLHWLFGNDEYLNGEHIAHSPSLWERIKNKPARTHYQCHIVIELKGRNS